MSLFSLSSIHHLPVHFISPKTKPLNILGISKIPKPSSFLPSPLPFKTPTFLFPSLFSAILFSFPKLPLSSFDSLHGLPFHSSSLVGSQGTESWGGRQHTNGEVHEETQVLRRADGHGGRHPPALPRRLHPRPGHGGRRRSAGLLPLLPRAPQPPPREATGLQAQGPSEGDPQIQPVL